MDKVTQVQNALNVVTSQIVDCLGMYPKKVQDICAQQNEQNETEKLASETAATFLKYLQEFREAANQLLPLADESNQLERIQKLESEIQTLDAELNNEFEKVHTLRNSVTEEFEKATQEYLLEETKI